MFIIIAAIGIGIVIGKLLAKYGITGRIALLVALALAPTLMGLLAKYLFRSSNISKSQIGVAAVCFVLSMINPIFGLVFGALSLTVSFDVVKSIPIVGTVAVIIDKVLGVVGNVYGSINVLAFAGGSDRMTLAKYA